METLPLVPDSAGIGPARHIDEYAVAGARYVQTGQEGAANTQRAYAGDWKRFTAWCREHGRASLPADVLTSVSSDTVSNSGAQFAVTSG